MTPFVAINPNNSCDTRAYDQLLFLEKLKYNTEQCEVESSFVHSREFDSILKQFKRGKQKAEDEKKWEQFLKRKLEHEINTKKSEPQPLSTFGQQVLDYNDFNFQSHNIEGVEYTNDWLTYQNVQEGTDFHNNYENENKFQIISDVNDSSLNQNVQEGTDFHNNYENENKLQIISNLNDSSLNQNVQEGTDFHNNHEIENKFQIISDLNDSSLTSFNNELLTGETIRYVDEEYCVRNKLYENDGNIVREIHLQNEETQNNVLHCSEQRISDNDCMTDVVNITEQKPPTPSKEKTCDGNFDSSVTSHNNSIEIEINATDNESDLEPVSIEIEKKEVIAASSHGSFHRNSTKKKAAKSSDKNSSNQKSIYTNDPEENYCKSVAKKIQDIPGVDNELRKVEDIRIKMRPILSNIKTIITKNVNSLLSSDEDLERIKQRTLEFGARFKRNYLYRTNCQVNKLKEMLPSPILISKKSKILLVIQKLTAVHHAVIQALQVIEKQLLTISIFGKTQELICSFYNCIYELTLTLKPFYGYMKTQVLDEVEKQLIETIELLKDFKMEEIFSIPNKTVKQKKNQLKSSNEPPPWMKKSAALARLKFGPPIRVRKRKSNQEQNPKLPEPKQSKDSSINDQDEKCDHEQDTKKPINFMMSVKQRPGAELRRANFDPIKTDEPKTMIEMISREGSLVDSMLTEAIQTRVVPESTDRSFLNETLITKEKLQKLRLLEMPEKTGPKNVKLICIKCDSDDIASAAMESDHKGNNTIQNDNLLKYKRAFKKYKKINPLYEKNTLNTVVSMSETFLEETMIAVSKEINKMKIADLLGIVDEVENFEDESLM